MSTFKVHETDLAFLGLCNIAIKLMFFITTSSRPCGVGPKQNYTSVRWNEFYAGWLTNEGYYKLLSLKIDY